MRFSYSPPYSNPLKLNIHGWHVDKDYEKAALYLSMAAKQGDKTALFELGGLYMN